MSDPIKKRLMEIYDSFTMFGFLFLTVYISLMLLSFILGIIYIVFK
jgi:hypothetical protein